MEVMCTYFRMFKLGGNCNGVLDKMNDILFNFFYFNFLRNKKDKEKVKNYIWEFLDAP